MANPYGIEQVDVPGILSAYDAGRARRVEMMLRQRMMEREDLQLEREHALHAAYAKIRPPGSGGAAAVNAYGAASTPSPSPADAATAPSASPAAVGAAAPVSAPVAASTAPVTAPTLPGGPSTTAPGTVPATWSEANQGVVGQLMAIDPEHAAQLSQTFRTMDDAQVAQVKRRNDAIAHVALGLKAIPEAERAAELQRVAPSALLPYGIDPAALTQADLSDRGLDQHIGEARDIESIIKDAKPDLMAVSAGSTLIDKDHPERGAVYTAPADIEHFTVHNGDGSETPYGFDKKTGRAFQLTEGGAPGASGGQPTGVGTSPAAAAVASTLTAAHLPAPVVAGFMGNFHVEGGYDGAQGDGGSASGIGQWHADRAATFQRVIGKPVTEADHADQARFVVWEMQNPQAAGMTVAQRDAILAAKTPAEAAELIDKYYERSSGRDRQIRMAAATAFANGSSPAPSGGTGTPIRGTPKPRDPLISDEAASLAAAVYRTKGTLPAGVGRTKGDVDKIMGVAAHMSMADAHRIADETVSTWQDTRAAQDTLVAFSKGKQADQTRSLNVAIHHIDLVRQAASALQNGNIQLFNSISQHIAQATGHAAPTNFDALKQFVFDEVTKGAIGNSGAVSDRQEAGRSASRASSPQQLVGVLDNYQTLLGGQARGLQRQYEAGTGRHDYADKYLEPRTRQILLGHGAGGATPAAPAIGEVRRGYRYKGGPPGSPSSWTKM